MHVLTLPPGTETFEDALRGYVRADRINDIVANPETARYRRYLEYCCADLAGEHPVDHNDEYRNSEERTHLVERALQAYERKHGVELRRGRIYLHDEHPIAATPHAVESELIGITIHVRFGSRKRSEYEVYREAVARGVTASMFRHAIAMLAVTNLCYWIHINYVEAPERGLRKMAEHEVRFSKGRAVDLMKSMINFAQRVRNEEAA